jgi:hypothetical protein
MQGDQGQHVTTTPGTSLEGMIEGCITSSLSSFLAKAKKPVTKAALSSHPLKRRTKAAPLVPRHSSHLARKACQRMSAVATAQNVLVKKLGIVGAQQLEAAEFKQYLKTFKEGLFVEQVKMIQDLFSEHGAHRGAEEGRLE